MTNRDTTTCTLPDEWLTMDWILAQGPVAGMNERELLTISAVVSAIGLTADKHSRLVRAILGELLPVPDARPGSRDCSKFKPSGLQAVLSDPSAMRQVRKHFGNVLETDEPASLCRKFLEGLTAA